MIDGNIAVGENGHPIVIQDDKTEIELRATELFQTKIPALNAEAKQSREDKQKFEKLYNELNGNVEGLDLTAARKALETVKGLEANDLLTAEAANAKREEITKTYTDTIERLQSEHTEKIKGFETSNASLESQVFKLKVSDRFKGSKALKGTIFEKAPELAISYFGEKFKIEEGEVVGYNGENRIANPDINKLNESANFDDSLTFMINNHPNSGNFKLAGQGANGGENPHIGNNGTVQATRADLQNSAKYTELVKKAGGFQNIQIVD